MKPKLALLDCESERHAALARRVEEAQRRKHWTPKPSPWPRVLAWACVAVGWLGFCALCLWVAERWGWLGVTLTCLTACVLGCLWLAAYGEYRIGEGEDQD